MPGLPLSDTDALEFTCAQGHHLGMVQIDPIQGNSVSDRVRECF